MKLKKRMFEREAKLQTESGLRSDLNYQLTQLTDAIMGMENSTGEFYKVQRTLFIDSCARVIKLLFMEVINIDAWGELKSVLAELIN